jgi:hypothetical protein
LLRLQKVAKEEFACTPTYIDNINPLTPELNPSAQRCLPSFFTGDFNF